VQATTLNLGFAATLPVFTLIKHCSYPEGIPPAAFATPLFWTMIPLSIAAGIVFILPYYILLCRKGHDAALPRVMGVPGVGQPSSVMPSCKSLCLIYVVSLILMLGLIALTMQALPH
jgi:hypothetical protein